jgi:hypothetical protein
VSQSHNHLIQFVARASHVRVTTYSFNYAPLGHISFAYTDAFLQAGSGSHRLSLRFDVSASWLDPAAPSAVMPALVTGQAWTTNPGPGLCPLAGLQPVTFALRGYPIQESLTIDLADDALLALENKLTGGARTSISS